MHGFSKCKKVWENIPVFKRNMHGNFNSVIMKKIISGMVQHMADVIGRKEYGKWIQTIFLYAKDSL